MVAVVALGVTLVWGGGFGAVVAAVGAILVGAWILMNDGDESKGSDGRLAGGLFGSPSGGAGSVDRKARASGPSNLR